MGIEALGGIIRGAGSKVKALLGMFSKKAGVAAAKRPRKPSRAEWLRPLADEVFPRAPRERRLAALVTAGLGVLCLLGAISVAVTLFVLRGKAGAGAGGKAPAAAAPAAPSIPREDLFLPEEPDFLPPALLGRERRAAWGPEEAGAFWVNPEDWRDADWERQVRAELDAFMETVR